ncbi:raftlin [Megalops cyprinoides]|uniref:raftlin n=1 Tax=Megalops cyprinoides TaxID=118141 RepID=UPI0018648CCC|nr:raftlin [Megalops cyprinoides]
MGCGLPKLKRSEDNSPGKIYSTLKRPQVETKVGVAYTYRFLDFILGKEGTSGLCLSSLRELPAQLQDLYQQGFVLAAVHPFIHPCGPEPASIQRQLYRAVLIKLSDSLEKTQSNCESSCLEMDLCLSADQLPSTGLIQGYVKKIQDAAEQGVSFVGFVQQPGMTATVTGQGALEDTSLSLHSSPSSILAKEIEPNESPKPQSGSEHQDCGAETSTEGRSPACEGEEVTPRERGTTISNTGNGGSTDSTSVTARQDDGAPLPDSPSPASQPDQHPETMENNTLTHNNNKPKSPEGTESKTGLSTSKGGMEVFALFNHPGVQQGLLKYYTVKVPLRVHLRDQGVSGVEANWLDHMTHHFNSGASLVDGYFHLNENDVMPKSVESVFIFQEGLEGDSTTATPYDAIVVEQWTVINGMEVKTDYIPLLQSLAMYGWKLTCVLPTPIVKTNSDGSLATKQIVFLQRPSLPRKKRESKKLGFKTRSKSNKNSIKDVPKNKRKKNAPPMAEKETEEQKMCEDEEKTCKGESEKVVRKNSENSENERQSLKTDRKEEKEGETDFKGGGGGTMVETEEEREMGIETMTEEKQEDRAKTEEERKHGAGEKTEEKDGGPKAVKEKEKEGRDEAVTSEEVALREEKQEEQESRATDTSEGKATEPQDGGAEDGQGISASENSGEGQMEDRADCESAVQVNEVSDITPEAMSSNAAPDSSSTDDPPTSID